MLSNSFQKQTIFDELLFSAQNVIKRLTVSSIVQFNYAETTVDVEVFNPGSISQNFSFAFIIPGKYFRMKFTF